MKFWLSLTGLFMIVVAILVFLVYLESFGYWPWDTRGDWLVYIVTLFFFYVMSIVTLVVAFKIATYVTKRSARL